MSTSDLRMWRRRRGEERARRRRPSQQVRAVVIPYPSLSLIRAFHYSGESADVQKAVEHWCHDVIVFTLHYSYAYAMLIAGPVLIL